MVSRSGQIRRPCRVMSSAVLPTTVMVASGKARRAPRVNLDPPTPPARITSCTPTSVPSPRAGQRWSGIMRLRGPATVVVLVALGLHAGRRAGARGARPAGADRRGRPAAGVRPRRPGPAAPAHRAGHRLLGPARPPPHARGLTVAALVLTAGDPGRCRRCSGSCRPGPCARPEARCRAATWSARCRRSVAGVVALGALIALLRRPAARSGAASRARAGRARAGAGRPASSSPTWASDAAVGTVWRRAGDAASERPATSWDAPASRRGGWGPDPGPRRDRRRADTPYRRTSRVAQYQVFA